MGDKSKDIQQKTDDTITKSHKTDETYLKDTSFPIVGIGASAGGLEALLLFFKNVPKNSRMAFIVVQHLDPSRKSDMVELLMRATTLQVLQAQDGLFVKPNCVYVIPPNKSLQLFHKVLHLFDPVAPRGLRLPIDFLFTSIADDLQKQAIAVILSGMGNDGTQGLKDINKKGGMVFVQDPAQAKFSGMPKSAISTGLVDEVALAEDLPHKIIDSLLHESFGKNESKQAEKSHVDIEKIIVLLRSQTGNDFSQYKKTTIYRRILRRMGLHQIEKLEFYVRFLQENPQEVQILFKELLIGVTRFFRDPETWKQLKEQVFPMLFTEHSSHSPLRIWVVGCSTGEEAYSLAITYMEALESFDQKVNFQIQIFATDLDGDAIDLARQGLYDDNIEEDVSPDRLKRFFKKEQHGYRIKKELRSMVVFAPQNIAMDPPFTKIDLLSCRNLMIYLSSELQYTLLNLFHYSLNPGGFLFLGSAETAGSVDNLFESIKGNSQLYKRLESPYVKAPFHFPFSDFHNSQISQETTESTHQKIDDHMNMENLTNQSILENYSPAAVLVSDKGDILYTKGNTGKYLQPASGKANWNIFAMARKGLNSKLHHTFHKALDQKITATINDIILDTDGRKHSVDVIVQPLKESDDRRLMLVIFTNEQSVLKSKSNKKISLVPTNKNRVEELEAELESSQQQLQNLLNESQIYKEDYLTAYEELQSTNEELQSTSEEITTSKEELQSLNEELQTVNYELQTKVDELSDVNDDMKNLLDSTDIATLFLGSDLHIRRYTPSMVNIINLIPGDIGRPITDIVSKLNYPKLIEDAQKVIKKHREIEKTISTSDDRWFQIRIMPYITAEEKIDGLVITYMDVSKAKKLEIELLQIQHKMETRIDKKDKQLQKAKKDEKEKH